MFKTLNYLKLIKNNLLNLLKWLSILFKKNLHNGEYKLKLRKTLWKVLLLFVKKYELKIYIKSENTY